MFKCNRNNLALGLVLFTLVIIAGCNGCKKETPHVTIPDHYEPVTFMRFEKELFSLDTNNLEQGLTQLHHKYGLFYSSYAHDLMDMGEEDDSLFIFPMSMLVKYQPFRHLQQAVDSAFGDMHDLADELGLATTIYKQEFPKKAEPHYVTFISEYAYANVTYDSLIGIGLDMYMNDRYTEYYHALEFPEFMIKKLRKEYIVPNTIKALGISQFEGQLSKDKRFIATMIFEGKVRYFMNALLPHVHDSIIMGYSAAQLKWCYENEAEMWAHFIEKDWLYKDEQSEYMRYFNDGPFTSADGVPPESSPAIGVFTGWQIVKKYMKQNPSITLRQLMEETDVDKILKASKYKP